MPQVCPIIIMDSEELYKNKIAMQNYFKHI